MKFVYLNNICKEESCEKCISLDKIASKIREITISSEVNPDLEPLRGKGAKSETDKEAKLQLQLQHNSVCIDDSHFVSEQLLKLFAFSSEYKPFNFEWANELRREHERTHWVPEEADLGEDIRQINTELSEEDSEFIKNILRLFTVMDVSVGANYIEQFLPEFRNNEIRGLLASIAAREFIHQEAYSRLNTSFGMDDKEYSAFLSIEEMANKVDFSLEADSSTLTGLALALAKTVFNEGVSLFSSFALLLNFQRTGLLNGMGKIVRWSMRDETLHVTAAAKIFSLFPKTDFIKSMIKDYALEIFRLEEKFISMLFGRKDEIHNLKKKDLLNYIKFMIDTRLRQLNCEAIFGTRNNPISWLNWTIGAADFANFFETKVVDYQKSNLIGDDFWN